MTNPPPKPPLSTAQKAGGAAGALFLAVGLIAGLEGVDQDVYLDIGGVPTVCYGHTGPDVKIGQKKRTLEECGALLAADAQAHGATVRRFLTRPIPLQVEAAFISFAYNVGDRNFRTSTLLRKANAGDLVGACNELPKWVNVNGKRSKGLVNRRKAELALCLQGATQ